MTLLRYSGPLWFLASIPPLYAVSDAGPFITPAAVLLALVLTERIAWPASRDVRSAGLRLLPMLYISCQIATSLWAAKEAAGASSLAFTGLALSIGICTGVFGVLAAHEMVHSRVAWHRQWGAALLTGMTYRHFRIAHVYGHHRFAATVRDPSTARLGESFYAFFLRTVVSQVDQAWRFEAVRCRGKHHPLLRNAITQDAAITAGVYGTLILAWGWRAAGFLAATSGIAILVLELFNYVAHYGLQREVRGHRIEAFAAWHSWNSSGAGNLLIFNMGRHSDHHRGSSASYEQLRPLPRQLELPLGYAASIMLALVPPLWQAVMDWRIAQLRAHPAEMGYGRTAAASQSLHELTA